MTNTSKPVLCQDCRGMLAKVERGDDGVIRLVIQARHHSHIHVNTYTLDDLRALWAEVDADTRHNT